MFQATLVSLSAPSQLVTSSDTKGVALPTLLPNANPYSNVSDDVLFQGVLHSDFGTYKCLARNKFGEISAVGELLVRGRSARDVIVRGVAQCSNTKGL